MARIGDKFKTGQTCETSGTYDFDSYVDGSTSPAPTSEERRIPLSKGETFPPVRSSGKAAWWKMSAYA